MNIPDDTSCPELAANACGIPANTARRIIIDVPPSKRTVWFRPSDGNFNLPTVKLRLSFPQLRFAMIYSQNERTQFYRLRRFFLAFVNQQNQICWPHLTNVYRELNVCMATFPECADPTTLLKRTFQDFWSSDFDTSTRATVDKYCVKPTDSMRSKLSATNFMLDWHKKTQANPEWIPDNLIPWSGMEISRDSFYHGLSHPVFETETLNCYSF